LAELGLERGYQQLVLTTSTFVSVTSGTAVAGFNFDTTYSDPAGGEYQIRLSSGASGTVYVTAVGRNRGGTEIRAIKTRYSGSGVLDNSIYSEGSVSVAASGNVEWAAIVSHSAITTTSNHPRLYSTSSISKDANGATPPNTDNIQWWSFQSNLPPMPSIDLVYYQGLAAAAGAAPAGCGGAYHLTGDRIMKGCNGGGAGVTGTFYTTGYLQFKAGSGGNIINGNVVTLGYVDVSGNGGATRSMNVPVPPKAWKEYGNDWAFYKATYDAAAPATYAAAVAADYTSAANKTINDVIVNGLIYAGGNFQDTGSGNANFYGVAIVGNAPSIGSNSTFYFNPTLVTAVRTLAQRPQRISWTDVSCTWSGASAVCP
jgi:hypothetical protein